MLQTKWTAHHVWGGLCLPAQSSPPSRTDVKKARNFTFKPRMTPWGGA